MKLSRKFSAVLLIFMAASENAQSYPLLDNRNPELWQQQPLSTFWLPSISLKDDERLQNDYSIPFGDPDLLEVMNRAWREQPAIYGAEIKSPPVPRQIGTNRLSKKDSFAARNWGDAGLPFSVLYMNNHTSKSSQSDSKKQTEKRPMNATTASVYPRSNTGNNNRSARNETSNKTRRQYSIIPQLFISYGWGSIAK